MLAAFVLSSLVVAQTPVSASPDVVKNDAAALDTALKNLVVPGGLTAQEAATLAADTNHDVEGKRATLDAADAAVSGAAFAFIPRVAASAGYTRLSPIDAPVFGGGDAARFVVVQGAEGPVGDRTLIAAPDFSFPVFLNQYAARAGVTVPVSDYAWRLVQSWSSAKDTQAAAKADVDVARVKAAADARIAFFTAARLHALALVAEKSRTTAETRIGDVQRSFELGVASSADVLRVQAATASTRLFEERAKNAADVADSTLRTLTHKDIGANVVIGEDVFGDAPDLDTALAKPEADLVDEAYAQRLEPRVLQAQIGSLQGQQRAGWATAFPRLDLTANAIGGTPHPRYQPPTDDWHLTWDAGASVSWTPSDVPAAIAGSSVLDARARALIGQRDALKDALRLDVSQALAAMKDARAALAMTTQARDAAEASYTARVDLFQAGRATLVELSDAETELLRARVEAVNARVDARIAVVRLAGATGRDAAALDHE